jgi:heme/copper-type cytochrome/quinol oxidase subunit 1
MNKVYKNIYILFWGFIPIFFVYGFLNLEEYLGIDIHDTYFVFSVIYTALWQSLLFFMFGLTYYLFYNKNRYEPINSLSILHISLTLIGLSILFFMPEFQYKLPVENTTDMLENLRSSKNNESIKLYSALGVFIAQLLFLVNLLVVLFRK